MDTIILFKNYEIHLLGQEKKRDLSEPLLLLYNLVTPYHKETFQSIHVACLLQLKPMLNNTIS